MAKTESLTKISVRLSGMRPLLFDRYAGDNTTKLAPVEKFYRNSESQLVMPSLNLQSFLSSQNSRSAAKDFYDKRSYKDKAIAILSFTSIEPFEPLITRNGKPIMVTKIGDADTQVLRHVARVKGGIPNPKERPMLPCPWELSFTLVIFPNPIVDSGELCDLFKKCGLSLGLGTFRGVFGKFHVEEWKKI